MKKIAIVVALAGSLSSLYAAPVQQQRPIQRQQQLQPAPGRPNANAARRLQNNPLLRGLYIRQLRQATDGNTEVYGKILPFLEEFLEGRLEISERRVRSLRELRQAVNNNGSEADLNRLMREIADADTEFQANQERFFSSVNPQLNTRQQARIRIMMEMTDNEIRRLLSEAQNSNQQQRPNAQRQQQQQPPQQPQD
jgi:hypothetical protein